MLTRGGHLPGPPTRPGPNPRPTFSQCRARPPPPPTRRPARQIDSAGAPQTACPHPDPPALSPSRPPPPAQDPPADWTPLALRQTAPPPGPPRPRPSADCSAPAAQTAPPTQPPPPPCAASRRAAREPPAASRARPRQPRRPPPNPLPVIAFPRRFEPPETAPEARAKREKNETWFRFTHPSRRREGLVDAFCTGKARQTGLCSIPADGGRECPEACFWLLTRLCPTSAMY